MNFPDTATLEPVCSLSGDALNTTPRPGGLPQRVWPAPPPVAGQAAVAGLQGHPPCLSPAQDRTAPFLSAPRPAQLHQSRRRAVHVERGVRSVRRAPAGGCPLLQRPILRTPLFDPHALSANSKAPLASWHQALSASRPMNRSLRSPSGRECRCPILGSLARDLRIDKPDTHLTMESIPAASGLPGPRLMKPWPSCSRCPRNPLGSPPPLLLLLLSERHSSRRRHAGPGGSCWRPSWRSRRGRRALMLLQSTG